MLFFIALIAILFFANLYALVLDGQNRAERRSVEPLETLDNDTVVVDIAIEHDLLKLGYMPGSITGQRFTVYDPKMAADYAKHYKYTGLDRAYIIKHCVKKA